MAGETENLGIRITINADGSVSGAAKFKGATNETAGGS